MTQQQFTLGEVVQTLEKLLAKKVTLHPAKSPAASEPLESIPIRRIRSLEEAGPGDLTFFAPTSKRVATTLLEAAGRTTAGAVLVQKANPLIAAPQIEVPHPFQAVLVLARIFHPAPAIPDGVDRDARVHESAVLDEGVSVGPFAVVGARVRIGRGTIIHPHAVIYEGAQIGASCILHAGAVVRENVIIGDDCVLQPGAVVGGDGFGYIPQPGVGHLRIPHVGTTILHSGVDMGANSTVDRGTFGDTVIGGMTKIDNLVMVGHNCRIGSRSLLCAMVGISGSCNIGDDVILGGNAGVADHITIRSGVRIGAKAGITGPIDEPGDYMGFPFRSASRWRREFAALTRLPEALRELKSLKSSLAAQGLLDEALLSEDDSADDATDNSGGLKISREDAEPRKRNASSAHAEAAPLTNTRVSGDAGPRSVREG